MKNLIIITGLLVLTSCGQVKEEEEKAVNICDSAATIAESMRVGDPTTGPYADENVKKVFSQCSERSEYLSAGMCWHSVTISKFNSDRFDWDYYYDFYISCDESGSITDISKQN